MRHRDKTNLSAKYAEAQAQARFSCPHEDARRAIDPQEPADQGPRSAVGLAAHQTGLRVRNPPSLRSGRDFRRVLENGQRAARDGLVAVALPNGLPHEVSRLGLAVRCKGGAVARSRVKRRIRAAFRQLDLGEGYDVVVQADDRILRARYSSLVEDLGDALDRATGASR